MPGQEGVTPVYSPMARTLEDLEYFWKAVMDMEPWKYDHSVGQYVSHQRGRFILFPVPPNSVEKYRLVEEAINLGCNVGRRLITFRHTSSPFIDLHTQVLYFLPQHVSGHWML